MSALLENCFRHAAHNLSMFRENQMRGGAGAAWGSVDLALTSSGDSVRVDEIKIWLRMA